VWALTGKPLALRYRPTRRGFRTSAKGGVLPENSAGVPAHQRLYADPDADQWRPTRVSLAAGVVSEVAEGQT
jgi:hypothetical protein